MMASFFNKKSVHNTTSYDPVPTELSDEDEDVLFQNGIETKSNGFSSEKKTKNGHTLIQMQDLGKHPPINGEYIVKVSDGGITKTRIIVFVLALIFCVCLAGMIILFSPLIPKPERRVNWIKSFDNLGTESYVRLLDVNDDGTLDVIFGGLDATIFLENRTEAAINQFCEEQGKGKSCIGSVYALDGKNGNILWEANTYNAAFEINCHHIDVNKDGKTDCIVTGRVGTVAAINSRDGSVLWEVEDGLLSFGWNTYQVLALPDFNGDGVPEVLLPHGGNPDMRPEQKQRQAGRLYLLDGATGKHLGKRSLDMPKEKETYMSPILHTRKDGSQYILFGSGGETVSGDFMMISLPDFYRYVMKLDGTTKVPKTKGKYYGFAKGPPPDQDGIMVVYSGHGKGVMVPPVLVDVTGDGSNDILMIAFDGTYILYDGETLQHLWASSFPGFESYSTPAPGYFNSDKYIDFMFTMVYGQWPEYEYSKVMILSGGNGQILWSLKAFGEEYSSPLSIKTTSNRRDAFIFQIHGRQGKDKKGTNKHGTDIQGGEEESDEIHRDSFTNTTCPELDKGDISEFFIIDRSSVLKPFKLFDLRPKNFKYNVTQSDRDLLEKMIKASEREDAEFQAEKKKEESEGQSSKQTHTERSKKELREPFNEAFNDYSRYPETNYDMDNMDDPPSYGDPPPQDENPQDEYVGPPRFSGLGGPYCAVMAPKDFTTGALGDMDGDGDLDLIIIYSYTGVTREEGGSYIGEKWESGIARVNIHDALLTMNRTDINAKVETVMKADTNAETLANLHFLPAKQQPWTGYMGKDGTSVYKP